MPWKSDLWKYKLCLQEQSLYANDDELKKEEIQEFENLH